MYAILKHFRFKDSFIMYVKTLLFSIQTRVINNWYLSDFFSQNMRDSTSMPPLIFFIIHHIR